MKVPQLKKKLEIKTCHNINWEDNYSWIHQDNILEVLKDKNKLNPEVKEYLEDENAYTEHHLKDTKDIQKKLFDEIKGRIILLPPSLSKGSYLKNFKNIQTAFASGWMSIRALRKRSGYDKGFAISDHADWHGILEVVKKSEAKNVFFHHGDSEALSKYLIEKESINVLLFGK